MPMVDIIIIISSNPIAYFLIGIIEPISYFESPFFNYQLFGTSISFTPSFLLFYHVRTYAIVV